MKKFSIILILSLLLGSAISPLKAQANQGANPEVLFGIDSEKTVGVNQPVPVDMFERQECGHCQDEKAFLKELGKEWPTQFVVTYHDIADEKERTLFNQVAEKMELSKATPITIINGVVLQGFGKPETTGKVIRNIILSTFAEPVPSIPEGLSAGSAKDLPVTSNPGDSSSDVRRTQNDIKYLLANNLLVSADAKGATCDESGDVPCETAANEYWVNIPFYGPVEVLQYSLPVMSLLLGFVDGFNPCAMWVLVMFLAILMEAGSRRRMFEMAGLFIVAEAIMYYLILNVWMTAWDFVGLDNIITPIVGFVAVGAGSWFLYLFYKNDTTCKVGDMNSKRKTVEKIKGYATAPMTIAVALGILALAFSVNIIEFACSIGIPQTFTKILDLNYLTWVQKQFYNGLYILMYMIDDLIVFAGALYAFDKIGLATSRYTRISHFVGGAIMLLLGLIMLFKPSLLIFG